MKTYSIEQVNEILELQCWSSCTCENEKDGQDCEGVDTIQIAVADDAEYFGEFVGNPLENEYHFILYTN